MKSYTGKGYTIYCHENRINGKLYIGQTRCQDLTRRWTGGHGYEGCPHFYAAIQKYGWKNFSHIILRTGLTKTEADEYEKIYINFFDTTNPDFGYNIQEGGHHSSTLSAEGRQRIVERFSGANSPIAKKVAVFSCDGVKLGVYDTVTAAARAYNTTAGSVSDICSCKEGSLKGHLFFFESDVHGLEKLPVELLRKPRDMRRRFLPVAQYDLSGKFLSSYGSIKEAASATGLRPAGISAVISGNKRTMVGGYMWRQFLGDCSDIPPYSPRKGSNKVSLSNNNVCMMDAHTREPIRVYPSVADASLDVGIPESDISRCLSTKSGTAGSFAWEYAGEYSSRTGKRTRGVNLRTPVLQLDISTGNVVARYSSIAEASLKTGINRAYLSGALNGRYSTCHGFVWKFAER